MERSSATVTEVLSAPFTINKLQIKNRIVLGPMAVLRPTAGRSTQRADDRVPHAPSQGRRRPRDRGRIRRERSRLERVAVLPQPAPRQGRVHRRPVPHGRGRAHGRLADLRPALPELRTDGRPAQRRPDLGREPQVRRLRIRRTARSHVRARGSGHASASRGDRRGDQGTRERRRRSRRAGPGRRASTVSRSALTCATSTRPSSRRSPTSGPMSTAARPRTGLVRCATWSLRSVPRSVRTFPWASG